MGALVAGAEFGERGFGDGGLGGGEAVHRSHGETESSKPPTSIAIGFEPQETVDRI